jgi:copper chaperone CopZ
MDFNTTIDLIIKDLNEAREIIDDLRNYPGVPSLQVELAKSKCKSAAEVIALLKNIQGQPVAEAKKKPEAGRPSFVITVDEIPFNKKKVTESAIVADTFSHLPNSLNEQLGNLRDDNDVSDILKTKPLTNLSDAIGVNDKFLFIRELFNGNPESYNQAISKLDDAASLADAKAVIMSYTDNDAENEAVRQLLDLVKRKFPVDE